MLAQWKRFLADKVKTPRQTSYPNTYEVIGARGKAEGRPEVFEPALKHFGSAFRLGDPQFPDAASQRAWQEAGLQVAHHLVHMLMNSPWQEHLVLRGSFLLKTWFGDAARNPHDIDWVFRPSEANMDGALGQQLVLDLIHMAQHRPHVGSAVIQADDIRVDDIWTYERASGRRIVFPWQADDLPRGQVQMDIVFGEPLFDDPVQTRIASPNRDDCVVWTASKELSLAWKLLWLQTDWYPRPKDLYDAALLAENSELSGALLYRVFKANSDASLDEITPDFAFVAGRDWDDFQLEYTSLPGTTEEWQARLATALAPLFQPGPRALSKRQTVSAEQ